MDSIERSTSASPHTSSTPHLRQVVSKDLLTRSGLSDLPILSSKMLYKLERKNRVFDKKLIQLIKKRRILYDVVYPVGINHNFKTTVKTNWFSIGKIMKTTVKAVQTRWLKIRRDYMEDKLEGRNEFERISPYHAQLEFLDPYILDSIQWASTSDECFMLQYVMDESNFGDYCYHNYLFNDPFITTFEEFLEFAHQFLRIPLHPEILGHNLKAEIRRNNVELKDLAEHFKFGCKINHENYYRHTLRSKRY